MTVHAFKSYPSMRRHVAQGRRVNKVGGAQVFMNEKKSHFGNARGRRHVGGHVVFYWMPFVSL